jgi:hypothetical protein
MHIVLGHSVGDGGRKFCDADLASIIIVYCSDWVMGEDKVPQLGDITNLRRLRDIPKNVGLEFPF